MGYATFSIIILAIIAIGYYFAYRMFRPTNVVKVEGDCASCDGTPNAKCEQTCMMEAAVKEIEYFDDEDLDAFKGRSSDSYSDDEASQFAYVMETMRPEEVRDWARSLTLRGISVPDQVKDEMFMLIDENSNESFSHV